MTEVSPKFHKEFYAAEGKHFCHYLGPRYIKLVFGLDFNYDTYFLLSPIECMKTCKISFFFIITTTVYRKTIHYWEIRAPYLRLGLHGSGHRIWYSGGQRGYISSMGWNLFGGSILIFVSFHFDWIVSQLLQIIY